MEPTTLRLPEDLLNELAEEADEHGFSSRSEYIRHVLRNRSGSYPTTERSRIDTEADTPGLEDRLAELEDRVERLEAAGDTGRDTPDRRDAADARSASAVDAPDHSGTASERRDASTQRVDDDRREHEAASPSQDAESDVFAAARNAVDAMTWTEDPRGDVDEYRTALHAVLEAITAADDGLSASDIRSEVYPDYSVGFDDDMNWWKNLVLQRLQELRDDHDLVHTEGGGRYTTWHLGPDPTEPDEPSADVYDPTDEF